MSDADLMSTSARLRQVQQDYAASQADLTRAEVDLSIMREALDEYAALYVSATAETARTRALLDQVIADHSQLRAALTAALNRRAD